VVEPLHAPSETKEQKIESRETGPNVAHNAQIRWEPRAIQFNSGRVELVLPYPVVFILVLGVLIVIMAVFKLGQYSSSGAADSQPSPDLSPQNNNKMSGESGKNGAVKNSASTQAGKNENSGQKGFDGTVRPDNAIVIQEHHTLADLVPVKRFFDENGIATEIIGTANTFFLVTKARFTGDPDREGSPGYLLEQQIAELGTKYQAPPDRARFADFRDAYGKYFDEQFQGEVVNVD